MSLGGIDFLLQLVGFNKIKYTGKKVDMSFFVCVNYHYMRAPSLSCVWLFVTPWTIYSLPPYSLHEIFQARILEWAAISFSRGSGLPLTFLNCRHIIKWLILFTLLDTKVLIPRFCCPFKDAKDLSIRKIIIHIFLSNLHSSVQSLSCVWLFTTPWITARQASLSIPNSWNLLKLVSIELVMPSNHLILCCLLLLLPSIFPCIRVFSKASALCIRWPKYWFQLQHQSFQWTLRTDLL